MCVGLYNTNHKWDYLVQRIVFFSLKNSTLDIFSYQYILLNSYNYSIIWMHQMSLTGSLFMTIWAVSIFCLRQTKLQGISRHHLSHYPCSLDLPGGSYLDLPHITGRMKDKPGGKSRKRSGSVKSNGSSRIWGRG